MFIYTIFDKVAKEPGPLFEAVNDQVAVRNVKENVLSKMPPRLHADYELYRVGSWQHNGENTLQAELFNDFYKVDLNDSEMEDIEHESKQK